MSRTIETGFKTVSDKFVRYILTHYIEEDQKALELRDFFKDIFESIENDCDCGKNGVNIIQKVKVSPFVKKTLFRVGTSFFYADGIEDVLWTADVVTSRSVGKDIIFQYDKLRCSCDDCEER